MPQLTTERSAASRETDGSPCARLPREAITLLDTILRYEAASQQERRSRDRPARKVDRVGLICNFLAVCARDVAGPDRNERAMSELCDSVLRADYPAHELAGTFLAALELLPKDVPAIRQRIRRAMVAVLQACVEMLSRDADPPHCI